MKGHQETICPLLRPRGSARPLGRPRETGRVERKGSPGFQPKIFRCQMFLDIYFFTSLFSHEVKGPV